MHWGILKKPTQPLEAAALQGQVLLLLLTGWGEWRVACPHVTIPTIRNDDEPWNTAPGGISSKLALRRRKAAQFVPELLPWWFPVQGISDSTEGQSQEQPPLNWFTVKKESLSRKLISFWLQMRHQESHWEENKVLLLHFMIICSRTLASAASALKHNVFPLFTLFFFNLPISL